MLVLTPTDAGSEHSGAKAVVDVHDPDAWRACVKHREQRRETAKGRSVAAREYSSTRQSLVSSVS